MKSEDAASNLSRPTLTYDEQRIVKNAIYGMGADNENVASVEIDITVQRKSVRTLQPDCWLNDEIINGYYKFLMRRYEESCKGQNEKKRCHFFQSFFMTRMFDVGCTDEYRYGNVASFSTKVPGEDIFQLDKIFFPCNVANEHWCCVVIFMEEKRIQFYDSRLGYADGMYYMKGLMQYLKDEWRAKKQGNLPDADKWVLVNSKDLPQQENTYDCGVFICMFADFLSLERKPFLNQEQITNHRWREKIALSIIKGVAIN